MPSPVVDSIDSSGITLTWEDAPPDLPGDLQRSIAQYEVTVTPQNGGDPITYYVPAVEGASVIISNLESGTPYDVQVNAVIETEGQGETTVDLGVPPLSITTGKNIIYINYSTITLKLLHNPY